MFLNIIIALTVFLSVAAISAALALATNFDSLMEYLGKREPREPREKPLKIRLNWRERREYMEFLFRHGYDPRDCEFARDALFEAMRKHELLMLNGEEHPRVYHQGNSRQRSPVCL